MYNCDKCSFVAKSKGGLTTHKKSHIEEDYNALVEYNKNVSIMYGALQKFDPSVRESKVIIDLAYKVDQLSDYIDNMNKSKEKLIETEQDSLFNRQRFYFIMTFAIKDDLLIFTEMKLEGHDKSLLSNYKTLYGWPDYIKYTANMKEKHVSGHSFTIEKDTERTDSELKMRFYLYTEATTNRRFASQMHVFKENWINNYKVLLPYSREIGYYQKEDIDTLIGLTYLHKIFK